MIWLKVCAKIYLDKQLLTKYCVIRHLELLATHIMMVISKYLTKWSTNFLAKNLETLLLTQKQELFLRIKNWLLNYTQVHDYRI